MVCQSLGRLTREVTVDDLVNRLACQVFEKGAKIISLNKNTDVCGVEAVKMVFIGHWKVAL